MEKLTVLQIVILLKAGTAVLGESQYTPATGRRTCPASYLTFAGPIVHTSVVPGERLQLHPRELCHLLLHGGHQQGPYRIYIANVVLLPEQRDKDIQMLIYKGIFAI